MTGLYPNLGNIENLAELAEENVERLEELIEESKEELKKWMGILKLSQTCRRVADEEATENKKGQLRGKWILHNIQGSKVWFSEVGNVDLKAGGKYEGFPKCLSHLRPLADDDRSTDHMVHRPKQDELDTELTNFDTLIDCQLAVEAAHENWQKKQKKEK